MQGLQGFLMKTCCILDECAKRRASVWPGASCDGRQRRHGRDQQVCQSWVLQSVRA